MTQKKNRAAIYCRLSVDDGVDQDSQSISNQKEVLTEYCLNNDFTIENIYVDDGISGTTFERPGFQKMIEAIEQGKVDIVVTKDLSRLGRDYLQTGYYTEIYFPEHEIRYIALNDRVDTNEGLDDLVPIKNIMNEFYARDISKKVRFTVANQMMKGEDKKSGYPLYGYKYDDNSKRIISKKEADIVKKIYQLFIDGNSVSTIAEILTKDKIPTPRNEVNSLTKYHWSQSTIRAILTNEEYLGHYIRKKKKKIFKSKKSIVVPKEERYVFKNKYPAIIDEESYNLVQDIITQTNHSSKDILKKNPYAGLCYCAICGKKMSYHKHTSGSGILEERIVCNGKEFGKGSIQINELNNIISNDIADIRDKILQNKALFLDEARLKASSVKTNSLSISEEERLERLKKRNIELDNYMKSLTEQLSEELINDSIYKSMMAEYQEEKETIEASINRFKLMEEKEEEKLDHQAHLLVETFENMKPEDFYSQIFLRSLISKILISSIPKPHTTLKKKEITIIYKKCNDYISNFLNKTNIS